MGWLYTAVEIASCRTFGEWYGEVWLGGCWCIVDDEMGVGCKEINEVYTVLLTGVLAMLRTYRDESNLENWISSPDVEFLVA